ncbi:hypothetical protein HHI36_005939 [Cryptolaemus montrouzieri]|uniref:Uncharacterized protein n=1 Tax=Cryptolaemus montrouzieri TaxID=559131 RepID=A0ABD2NVN2_9CUCU
MASFAEINRNSTAFTYNSVTTTPEEILNAEYKKYVLNKIIFQSLQECTSNLDDELGGKVDNIINDVKLKQYLKIGNHNLLGIQLHSRELNYQEGERLKSALQTKIWQNRMKVFEEFKKITNMDLEDVAKMLKTSAPKYETFLMGKDHTLILYKNKLVKEQEIFMNQVMLRSKLLDEILELRSKKIPNMCEKAYRTCKAKVESNYLKSKIAEYKTKLDIFMEEPKAIQAYQLLLKDIKQQQEECELSIKVMKENKVKYEEVSGREFDEILKPYLMYKASIDKLNKMYAFVK